MIAEYSELRTDIELIKKDIAYIKENIYNINKCLNGNGTPGHSQRIERLEAFQNKIIGALVAMNVIWGVIAVVLGFVI